MLITTGIGCVVLGGVIAAVTGPFDLAHGSWLAAYLVLVGGVAQCAMGLARVWNPSPQPTWWAWTQLGSWNLGNVAVIVGTLTALPLVVDLGSVGLVVALVIALHAPRVGSGAALWTYRALLLLLALSIPVGVVLAHLRNS
ncbi:MAG: hypothetical protein GX610_02600 [Rhodococcus sp.]|nr:hypothetical protein [Rhodococcus sp. (in: high G+C Gram-positive bacteria)]